MSKFQESIARFNAMYKLPVASTPTLSEVGDPAARLKAFKDILLEELNEIDDIIELAEQTQSVILSTEEEQKKQALLLTDIADLLGDIQVYCASEMAKFGLPLDNVLDIIMESNFSKLGYDGKPIYDGRGKVQKGPRYWRPEPRLTELIESLQPK